MAVQATKMVADVTWKEKWAKKVGAAIEPPLLRTISLLPVNTLLTRPMSTAPQKKLLLYASKLASSVQ